MSERKELIARLRLQAQIIKGDVAVIVDENGETDNYEHSTDGLFDTLLDASDALSAAQAEIARLKEALEPYANEPLSSEPKFHRTRIWSLEDQDAYIRRARSALSGKQSDG